MLFQESMYEVELMPTVELPYEIGTFVRAMEDDILGTVAAYTVGKDGYLIWVSGYKEPWCGEYLPDTVRPLTEAEIAKLIEERGE